MQNVVLRNFTKFTGKHLCQSLFLKDSLLWILWNFKKHLFYKTRLATASKYKSNANWKNEKKPYLKEKGNMIVTLDMLSKISWSTFEILIKIYEHLCSSVKKAEFNHLTILQQINTSCFKARNFMNQQKNITSFTLLFTIVKNEHTYFKILRCKTTKLLKNFWPFFNIMNERVVIDCHNWDTFLFRIPT